MQFTTQWLHILDVPVVFVKPTGALKAPTEILMSLHYPSSKKQCQNQTNFINTQTGCIGVQPEQGWSLLVSNIRTTGWTERESSQTQKGCNSYQETIAKREQEAVNEHGCWGLTSGWQLRLGRVARKLRVAPRRVVLPQQLAGFIRSTFSSPDKQPGSLLALLALRCTFFFFYDQ